MTLTPSRRPRRRRRRSCPERRVRLTGRLSIFPAQELPPKSKTAPAPAPVPAPKANADVGWCRFNDSTMGGTTKFRFIKFRVQSVRVGRGGMCCSSKIKSVRRLPHIYNRQKKAPCTAAPKMVVLPTLSVLGAEAPLGLKHGRYGERQLATKRALQWCGTPFSSTHSPCIYYGEVKRYLGR